MWIVLLVQMAKMMQGKTDMRYYDYEWDCSATGIILDAEFNSDKLGWQGGDYFRLVNVDGRQHLVKVQDIERFIMDGVSNQTSGA